MVASCEVAPSFEVGWLRRVWVRNRVTAGRISWLELKSYDLQFLSENFLALFSLGLVCAQLGRLSAVDANDVIVCHCSN